MNTIEKSRVERALKTRSKEGKSLLNAKTKFISTEEKRQRRISKDKVSMKQELVNL